MLYQADLNVISVDWSRLAGPAPFYFTAARNAKAVGGQVAKFIKDTLIQEVGVGRHLRGGGRNK